MNRAQWPRTPLPAAPRRRPRRCRIRSNRCPWAPHHGGGGRDLQGRQALAASGAVPGRDGRTQAGLAGRADPDVRGLRREDTEQAGSLPRRRRDPFCRFLIAQAQAEGLVLVTRDARIALYGVRTMAAQNGPDGNTCPCPPPRPAVCPRTDRLPCACCAMRQISRPARPPSEPSLPARVFYEAILCSRSAIYCIPGTTHNFSYH